MLEEWRRVILSATRIAHVRAVLKGSVMIVLGSVLQRFWGGSIVVEVDGRRGVLYLCWTPVLLSSSQ